MTRGLVDSEVKSMRIGGARLQIVRWFLEIVCLLKRL
jgi:hypothetical protein